MQRRKIVTENKKRILFIFFLYLKDQTSQKGLIKNNNNAQLVSLFLGLSLLCFSLPLSFLHIEFFHHPRVLLPASVAYVPKITCCLFCLLLLFSMLHLKHVGSELRKRQQIFTIIYRLFSSGVFSYGLFTKNINNLCSNLIII